VPYFLVSTATDAWDGNCVSGDDCEDESEEEEEEELLLVASLATSVAMMMMIRDRSEGC